MNGWHRDIFGFAPRGNDYLTPRQILALTYLEDMTEEYGPLRVNGQLEQSRINSGFLIPDEQAWKEWADQDKAALNESTDW